MICTIPRKAVDDGGLPGQSRPSLYGHGLLGGAGEVGGGNVQAMGQEHNFVFCATDWAGMSTLDVPHVATLLQDLSRFNTLVDRIQQGYVNFMYLGRWLLHPDGASANPAFQVNGASVIDTDELFYDGNSQGGILSGGLTALSPDFRAAVHGVPGMNYSTLLSRSVDFDMYANGNIEGLPLPIGLYQAYPNELERPLIFSLMQLLWDRGESNGYAQHMTNDPLPGSPEHRVLLHPAFGDHQVANVAADVEARTIRACTNRPVALRGALARRGAAVRRAHVRRPRLRGIGHHLLRHRPGAGGRGEGNPRATDGQRPAARGQRPPQRAAQRPHGAPAEVGLPEDRWRPDRRVRPAALLRGRLHRALDRTG